MQNIGNRKATGCKHFGLLPSLEEKKMLLQVTCLRTLCIVACAVSFSIAWINVKAVRDKYYTFKQEFKALSQTKVCTLNRMPK